MSCDLDGYLVEHIGKQFGSDKARGNAAVWSLLLK